MNNKIGHIVKRWWYDKFSENIFYKTNVKEGQPFNVFLCYYCNDYRVYYPVIIVSKLPYYSGQVMGISFVYYWTTVIILGI